jgi:hypothetical protein
LQKNVSNLSMNVLRQEEEEEEEEAVEDIVPFN